MKRLAYLLIMISLFLTACSRDQNDPMRPDARVDIVPDLVDSNVVNDFDPLGM